MKYYIYSLVLITFILPFKYVTALMLALNGVEKECLTKYFEKEDKIVYSFVISGENEESVETSFYDPFYSEINSDKNKQSGSYNSIAQFNGIFILLLLRRVYFVFFEYKKL